jgi:hypothetical protein
MKKLMLIIVTIALFGLAQIADAKTVEVTLAWQQEMTCTVDGQQVPCVPVGWNVYQSEAAGTYGTTPIQNFTYDGVVKPEYQTAVTFQVPLGVTKKFYYVVTAYNADGESGRSNEVFTDHYFPFPAVAPSVPGSLKATSRVVE